MSNKNRPGLLVYEGCNFLRQRLLLSTLSGKSIKITSIRSREENPGVNEYEASLIRLFDKITNGSRIEVSETGTELFYQPGLLIGGRIEHDCNLERAIGYYLEPVMCLAPFCKKPLEITLKGVTNNNVDPSADAIKAGMLPVLKRFLLNDDDCDMKVQRRGLPPKGGGQVHFTCPVRRQLRPLQFLNPGKIRRIRGVAFAVRVAPAMANRAIESAKGILLKFLPDVYIYSDHRKVGAGETSPGFGVTLCAETANGACLTASCCSKPPVPGEKPNLPEDIGKRAAFGLLEEIYRGGCVDSISQTLACSLMAMGQKDVSKVISGPLSPYTIEFLRHIKDVFNLVFKLEVEKEEEEDIQTGVQKVCLTCLGIGYNNLSKMTM